MYFFVFFVQNIDKLCLMSVWDKSDCDFTHIHTDKSVSKIDHFMCNERLFNFIEQCSPIHSGDNFSRHSPIVHYYLSMTFLGVKL